MLVAPFIVTAVFLHQGTLAELRAWDATAVATAFLGFAISQALATWLSGRLVDRIGSLVLMRAYLAPLGCGLLALGFVGGHAGLWLLFCGLGLTAGSNAVVAGAVWAEIFGTKQLGMVRGVYAGFMVLATAISPALLGLALSAGLSLGSMAIAATVYTLLVPQLAARQLRGRRPRDRS